MHRAAKIILSFLLLVGLSYAQEVSDTPDSNANGDRSDTALGARQQRVKRLMLDLERKFNDLASKLEADQPEQAKKLTDAFQRSKELIMQQRMDEVTALLNNQKLESASDEQGKIAGDIQNLISILLQEGDELEKMKEKIKELEAMKEKVADLIEKEKALKEGSGTVADKEGKLSELDEQIRLIEALIKKQEALKEKTKQESVKGLDKVEKLAPEQAQLRAETEALAKQLAGDESESLKNPGAQPMKQAVQNQIKAEGALSAGLGADAQKAENDAIKELRRAVEELTKERERIATIDPAKEGQKLAQEQSETASEAETLAQEMAESGEGEPKPGEAEQAPKQEPSAEKKAAEAMEHAKEEMDKAAQELGEQKPQEAEEKQEEAIEDLEEALGQLEKKIEELKEEIKEELIAQLEEIFTEMLETQKKLTKSTADLDHQRKQSEKDKLARAQRVLLRNLSRDEKRLSQTAGEAETLLFEDGTSIVVLSVVSELKDALLAVGELMDDGQTGEFVQRSQKEIELTLAELIEAMQKAQDQMPEPPSDPKDSKPGESKPPPLLPPAAELKMLKFSQLRVNRRTVDFHNAKLEAGSLDDKMLGQAAALTAFQAKVTAMARKMSAQSQ